MRFLSGFSLQDVVLFFDSLIDQSDFSLCGFSYGAIGALKEALQRVQNSKRLDRLQLFSPAFFQTKGAAFKRLQLRAYVKDERAYLQQFICNAFSPYTPKHTLHKPSSLSELQELLDYVWSDEELSLLQKKGVKIEVYLGGEDAIIESDMARDFFIKYATVTIFKDANHFLQTC